MLLARHAPEAAGLLSTIEYASVAVVTLAFPAGAIRAPLTGTGFLVPRTSTIDGRPTARDRRAPTSAASGRTWPGPATS